jgi:hypothetical protein
MDSTPIKDAWVRKRENKNKARMKIIKYGSDQKTRID